MAKLKRYEGHPEYLHERKNKDTKQYRSDLAREKRHMARIARELGYGSNIIGRIKAATTLTQLNNIMVSARQDA